jgi:hypothetical protein
MKACNIINSEVIQLVKLEHHENQASTLSAISAIKLQPSTLS